MELKQRKQINNIPKYEDGKISFNPNDGVKWVSVNNKFIPFKPADGVNSINFGIVPAKINPITLPDKIDASAAYTHNIKNPATASSTASSTASEAANIITTGVDFVGAGINDFQMDRKTGEIISDAGGMNINAGGFSWRKQNAVDEGKEMSDLHKQNVSNTLGSMGKGAAFGAAIGSIFPGAGNIIGGAIGAIAGLGLGLLGGGSRHKKMRKQLFAARKQIENNNNMAFAGAQSDYLAQQYNLNNAYTQDDELYVAKYGKSCMGLMKPRKR